MREGEIEDSKGKYMIALSLADFEIPINCAYKNDLLLFENGGSVVLPVFPPYTKLVVGNRRGPV